MKTTPIHGYQPRAIAGRSGQSAVKNHPPTASVRPEARPLPQRQHAAHEASESGHALTAAVALLALLMKRR